MQRLIFVLPDGSDLVSGGNLYNAALIGALRPSAEIVTLEIGECGVWLGRGEPGLFLVDTLDLAKVASLPSRSPQQRLGLVVHHLPSLEPGSAPGDPALLVEEQALARFDLFVATSPFTADHLVARGVARNRIVTVPPGVAQADGGPRAFAGPLRALLVANLIPRKGIVALLEALDRLATEELFALEIFGRDDLDPS